MTPLVLVELTELELSTDLPVSVLLLDCDLSLVDDDVFDVAVIGRGTIEFFVVDEEWRPESKLALSSCFFFKKILLIHGYFKSPMN